MAKPAYKSNQARTRGGEDRNSCSDEFKKRNVLKRYSIASHLLKLNRPLKPVSLGGQKPLTWCAS